MQVESAQPRHGPHHFRQHPECYDDEQVCIERPQPVDKFRIFQLLGLHYAWKPGFGGIALNGAFYHLVAASSGLVGHRYHTYYVVSALVYAAEAADSEVGIAHEHYP